MEELKSSLGKGMNGIGQVNLAGYSRLDQVAEEGLHFVEHSMGGIRTRKTVSYTG